MIPTLALNDESIFWLYGDSPVRAIPCLHGYGLPCALAAHINEQLKPLAHGQLVHLNSP